MVTLKKIIEFPELKKTSKQGFLIELSTWKTTMLWIKLGGGFKWNACSACKSKEFAIKYLFRAHRLPLIKQQRSKTERGHALITMAAAQRKKFYFWCPVIKTTRSRTRGSYESWKTWKVLEFYYGIFQDWKVLEKGHCSWKVLEIC